MTPLHIAIAGPIATRDVAPLLDGAVDDLPAGCEGAPLLVTLIAELLRLGHRVSAFTLSNGMALRPDARVIANGPGLTLHYCPNRPRAWPPNGRLPGRIIDLYAFERRGLQAAMRDAGPDVVHAHWSYEFAWAALRSGLPHVITCHDSPVKVARFYRDFRHGAYRWLRAGIAWHVLRHADRVTAVSPYMASQVQGMCRVPVAVVPNPISARASRQRVEVPGRLRVIMVCNGWGALKNGEPALQAFAQLAQRRPTVELHVYGHDFERGGAAQRWWDQQGFGTDRIVFNGSVAHDRVLDAMADSDLLLHPSLEESFGAVLGEAMAMGLPVVAGAFSGAVPWVVGDAGRLVDVRDPDRMAAAMDALLGDERARHAHGRLGRERVREHFSPDVVASRYLDEYEAAIAAAASRASAAGAKRRGAATAG